jgi:hypothetical protein
MPTKKMYLALGLNETDCKMFMQPNGPLSKKSPYLQTALVFFADNEASAQQYAQELLGNEASHVQQIGRINVDVSGGRREEHTDSPGIAADILEFHVFDQNDTDEGCVVSADATVNYLQDECPKAGHEFLSGDTWVRIAFICDGLAWRGKKDNAPIRLSDFVRSPDGIPGRWVIQHNERRA